MGVAISLLIIAFLVWIYRAWRALRMLRLAPVILKSNHVLSEKVSVIIPAKNEEANIATCIEGFLNQKNVDFEIIVANDNSIDETENILKSYGDRIGYVNVPPTPEGWTGKNFAIHHAMEHAHNDWFLFTDADTRHEPFSVVSSLAYALENKIRFLTLLPECLTGSFWELLIQPLAMAYLGLWFPIEDVNNPEKEVYFANLPDPCGAKILTRLCEFSGLNLL